MESLRRFTPIAPLSLALSCTTPYPEAAGLPPEAVAQIRALVTPLVEDHIRLNKEYHAEVPADCDYTLAACPQLQFNVAAFDLQVDAVQAQVMDLLQKEGCAPVVTLVDLKSFEHYPNFTNSPSEDASRYWVDVEKHWMTADCGENLAKF